MSSGFHAKAVQAGPGLEQPFCAYLIVAIIEGE
jgi:hypothetical protein